MSLGIKKGDKVIVLSGKDKGKTGAVNRVLPKVGRVIVEGVAVRKRHLKPRRSGKKGEVVEFNAPISISNVSLMDASGKATRIRIKEEKGKKIRVSVKTQKEI